jgi:hypothetical protein
MKLIVNKNKLIFVLPALVLILGLTSTQIYAGGGGIPSTPPISCTLDSVWIMVLLLAILILVLFAIVLLLVILKTVKNCCCGKSEVK